MKRCYACGQTKAIEEFHRSKIRPAGRVGECKGCKKKRAAEYRARTMPRWWKRTRALYRDTYEREARRVKRAPLEIVVKTAEKVSSALKALRLRHPKGCSICGGRRRIVAHHRDYTEPFAVVWMCTECHNAIHNLARKLAA